jgi:hypothetical protein
MHSDFPRPVAPQPANPVQIRVGRLERGHGLTSIAHNSGSGMALTVFQRNQCSAPGFAGPYPA